MHETVKNFAKIPTQPPPFDMGAFAGHAGLAPADIKNAQTWKRWIGGELEFDGTGLRDVVDANAQGLNAVKGALDVGQARQDGQIAQLLERVTALEARPADPFPGSS